MSGKGPYTEDPKDLGNDSDSEPRVGEMHYIHEVDQLVEVPSIWQRITNWSKKAGAETIGVQRLPEEARNAELQPWRKC